MKRIKQPNAEAKKRITLAGWPCRHFELEEWESLFSAHAPPLIEISKDFIRDNVSLKALAHALDRVQEKGQAEVALAGTTDLVSCAGFSWNRYLDYMAVQLAQARFLGCRIFRFFLGQLSEKNNQDELLRRVLQFCRDAAPMKTAVEIHGGAESDPSLLKKLLDFTPVLFVIDFENMHKAQLTTDMLNELVLGERIAYFHQRNLPGVWVEHEASLEDEVKWQDRYPGAFFLWEPKKVENPNKIKELFLEYQASD